ncbi:hypothetical protein QYZ87_02900 [Porphyromonadaceae bacterium W3.11]|nr:hypothetical protein [Porphyromonadaceae bacterium W3.11]
MNTGLILTLVIIAIIIVIAIVLLRRIRRKDEAVVMPPVDECKHAASGGCCGGVNCERAKKIKPLIVYFEDEELDAYIGRAADSYTHEEVEEFREVLNTLQPEEVNPWLKSLKLRKVELPVELAEKV